MEFIMNIRFNWAYTVSKQYPTSAGIIESRHYLTNGLLTACPHCRPQGRRAARVRHYAIPTRIIWILITLWVVRQAPSNNELARSLHNKGVNKKTHIRRDLKRIPLFVEW